MTDRKEFISFRVSKDEKKFLERQAIKHNVSISDIIRRRAIRPEQTNNEQTDLLMQFIGKKFKDLKTTLLKRTSIQPKKQEEEISRIKRTKPSQVGIKRKPPQMLEMLEELKELGGRAREMLREVPEEELRWKGISKDEK
jgi:hypothetical protein